MTTDTSVLHLRREALTEQALLALEVFPASDSQHKYALLSTATRALNDPSVLTKWIALISIEQDTKIKCAMIQRLNTVAPAQLYESKTFTDTLLKNFAEDECKEIILSLLGRHAIVDVTARKHLIEIYDNQSDIRIQHLILSWLLESQEIPEDLIAFFSRISPKTNAVYKQQIILRLLHQHKMPEGTLRNMLHLSEDIVTRNIILSYCIDRSLLFAPELLATISNDTDAENRMLAVRLLAAHGINDVNVVAQLLSILKSDQDEKVRKEVIAIFEYALVMSAPVIDFFATHFLQEKNRENARLMLSMLAPYFERNAALRKQLLGSAMGNVHADIALILYKTLGRFVTIDHDILQQLLSAYQEEVRTDCKAVILQAITLAPAYTEALIQFYIGALKAPSLEIQSWGLQGFLQLPLTEANTPLFNYAAEALRDARLDSDKRLLLAKKISRIPNKSSIITDTFRKIIDHDGDENIRAVCREALSNTVTMAGESYIDWEQWLYQADVEHNVTAIFPNLWLHYDNNPVMGKKILWAALSPACSNSLYKVRVNDHQILKFLSMRNAIDDDLSRYCVNKILTDTDSASPNHYLVILKANLSFPELKDVLWPMLEKTYGNMNMLLFKELLEASYGMQAYHVLETKMQTKDSAKSLLPYLRFLLGSMMPINFERIAQMKAIIADEDNLRLFKEIIAAHGISPDQYIKPIVAAGPGFAD